MERCPRCGEPLADFAGWCSLCHAKRFDRGELADDLRATVGMPAWLPSDRHRKTAAAKRFSRVQEGPLSFGWRPRLALTLATVLAGWFVIAISSWNEIYRGVAVLFVLLAGGLALRSVWRRERIE